MEGDELPIRLGDRRDLGPDPGVEGFELLLVGGRLGLIRRGVGRICRPEGLRDPIHVQLGVFDVHPQMRILRGRGLAGQQRHARQVDPELEQRRSGGRGVGDRLGEPVVQAEPVHDQQLRAADGAHVGRSGLEGVDVGVLGHDAGDGNKVAADVRDQIRENRRGRHHGQFAVGAAARRRTGASGQERGRRQNHRHCATESHCGTPAQISSPPGRTIALVRFSRNYRGQVASGFTCVGAARRGRRSLALPALRPRSQPARGLPWFDRGRLRR